jgi:hypothetical protein
MIVQAQLKHQILQLDTTKKNGGFQGGCDIWVQSEEGGSKLFGKKVRNGSSGALVTPADKPNRCD